VGGGDTVVGDEAILIEDTLRMCNFDLKSSGFALPSLRFATATKARISLNTIESQFVRSSWATYRPLDPRLRIAFKSHNGNQLSFFALFALDLLAGFDSDIETLLNGLMYAKQSICRIFPLKSQPAINQWAAYGLIASKMIPEADGAHNW
jgi:hypothetical protein